MQLPVAVASVLVVARRPPTEEREASPASPPALPRRRLLLGGLLALLLVAGVALLLGKAAGYAHVLQRLRAADPSWLALALAAEGLCFAGYIVALRAVARSEGGPALSYRGAAHLAFAALGAGRLFFGGGAGALALDYWAFRTAGAAKDEAAARVLALNIVLIAAAGAGTWLAALVLTLAEPGAAPLHLTLPWLVAVPALFAAARLFEALPRPHWLGRLTGWLSRSLTALAGALAFVWALARQPRANATVLAAALLDWGGDALCLWAGLRSFGIAIDPARLALAYGTGYAVTLLPLPFGGVGSADAAMAAAVRAVGVPLAPALLGVLAYRLFSFWLPTIPGIAAVIALEPLGRRLARSPRNAEAAAPPLEPTSARDRGAPPSATRS